MCSRFSYPYQGDIPNNFNQSINLCELWMPFDGVVSQSVCLYLKYAATTQELTGNLFCGSFVSPQQQHIVYLSHSSPPSKNIYCS